MAEVLLEGNKGADYIEIIQTDEQKERDTFTAEIGSCCVVTGRYELPVEFLTALLTKEILNANGDIEKIVKDTMSKWDKDFVNERVSHVKTLLVW